MSRFLSRRSWPEGVADTVLFFFVTVPLLAVLITIPFCSGWNESTGTGTCTLPMLENFYNGIMGLIVIALLAGPIFLISPIVLISGIVSVMAKIRRISGGYRPRTALTIIYDFAFIIPLVAIVVLSPIILGSCLILLLRIIKMLT